MLKAALHLLQNKESFSLSVCFDVYQSDGLGAQEL